MAAGGLIQNRKRHAWPVAAGALLAQVGQRCGHFLVWGHRSPNALKALGQASLAWSPWPRRANDVATVLVTPDKERRLVTACAVDHAC